MANRSTLPFRGKYHSVVKGQIVSKPKGEKNTLAERARRQREVDNFARKQWVRLTNLARVFVARYPLATPARLIGYFQHHQIVLSEAAARKLLSEITPKKKK